jgi:adenylosuccinate synthase
LGVPIENIKIDSLAMWLTEGHAVDNRERGDKRGTTGWGVGAATAEKVARSPETKLLREWAEEQLMEENQTPWVGKLSPIMNTVYSGPGLFEGSQGFMLSLNHGRYPYSTAKDVTITNMCSELGISAKRIRKVIGVVRLVFMRVSGPSGPTGGQEVSYDEVEQRTGLRFPNHKRMQGDSMKWTSTVGKAAGATDEERLFDYSMEELLYSHTCNGYDELAVTFCDMHRKGNYRVTEWSDLHPDTQLEIQKIERTLGVPVTLVRTGQGETDNIWTPGGTLDLPVSTRF